MIKILRMGFILLLIGSLVACGSNYSDEQRVERAQEFLDEGELNSASIELKNALRENPDNMQARWLLGKLHLEMGNAAAAEKELSRAKELGVADELIAPLMARALVQQGKTAKVQKLSKDNLTPEQRATVASNQGLGKLIEGKQEDAEALIEEALSNNPNSVEAIEAKARLLASRREYQQAREQLDRVFELDPEFGQAWSLLGDIEQQEKNPEQAIEAYTKAIEFRANNTSDRLKRALGLLGLQKMSEAQTDVDILLKQSPLHPGVNYAQGLILLSESKLKDAQAAFDLALAGKNRYPLALYFSGITNLQLGNMVQARLHAEEFYARFRNYLPARKLLAMVNLAESKYAEVEQLLRPVVEAKEDDVVALNLLSNALMGLGKMDEAIELLSKVAALQPDSPMAQVRLGAGLLMSGEQGGGIEHLESAVRLDPSNQKADVLLVLNHLQQKQFDQALQAAEAYRQRNPESTAPHNLLGRVYFLMGEIDNAKKSLNNALKMEPSDPVANQALAALALENGDKKAARTHYQNVLKKRENHLSTLILLAALDAKEDKEADMVKRLEQAVDAYPRAIQPRLLLAKHYLQKKEPERVPLLFVDVEDSQRNLPPVLDAIALSQLMKKEFSLAKSTLKKRAELPPESAQTHNLLARAYIGLNDFQQAKKELHRAIEIDPKHFEARLALTKILVLEKNTNAVKENVQVLKEIAPDVVDVVALEVSLAQMEGDKEKAHTLAKNFHEKSPSTNSMLMVASQKRSAGDVKGSIEFQEQWLKEHPDDLMAHLALANVHIMDSRIDAAIEQNKKILQLDENNLIALNNLAWHLKDSQPEQALEYAQRVNELAPENAAMMDTLAVVMLKNGQAKKAQRIMDKVLKLQPKDPTLRYHSAMIDAAAGDLSTAEVKLTSLIEGGEKFPEKEEAVQLLSELQSGQ